MHGTPSDRRFALGRVLEARIARLSPACRRLLALASVLGRELDAAVLLRLGGPDLAANGLMDEALASGVLVEVLGEGRRLRFAHALLRDACYGSLPPSVRARAHRDAASVLAAMPRSEAHAAAIAHHLAAGARDQDRVAAGERLLLAGDGALRSLAFEEAARLCRRGLEVLGRQGDPHAEALRDRLRDTLERALRAAEPPSPP